VSHASSIPAHTLRSLVGPAVKRPDDAAQRLAAASERAQVASEAAAQRRAQEAAERPARINVCPACDSQASKRRDGALDCCWCGFVTRAGVVVGHGSAVHPTPEVELR
jgi:hypothetical protein